MKHEASAPQVQQNGLYWEAQRVIHETEAELRLLSEHRAQAIKVFRAQEEALQEILRRAVETRDRLQPERE